MPNDVKAIVSVVTLIVAALFAYWEKSNGRQDLFWIVIGLAIFSVIAMWVFPEAEGGKKNPKKTNSRQSGPPLSRSQSSCRGNDSHGSKRSR